MLARKQNVFDDFIAAAEWLIDDKITTPEQLAISGGSNGGLLVGAALTQRPELFRAVVCGVPLLDMVRYHSFRIAQLWIPEYGSPDDPEAVQLAATPTRRTTTCKDGVAYPAVLLPHRRVRHPRRPHARAQDDGAPAGGDRRRPPRSCSALESKAGHGAGKPLGKVIDQLTDEWSFLFSQLGIVDQ